MKPQKNISSSTWETTYRLCCDGCNKYVRTAYNLRYESTNVYVCCECFRRYLSLAFKSTTEDFIRIRMVVDVMFEKRKENTVKQRNKMNNALRYKVLKRSGFRCEACGNTAKESKLHVDHIVPIVNGGLTELSNLQTLCQVCNSGKGAS